MSKRRRKRLNRNKRTRSHRKFIRNGVEQLENRVPPGGFLDLLAGAAIAASINLLPEEQLVAEEVESKSDVLTLRDRAAGDLLFTRLSLPEIDLEPREVRVELTPTEEDVDVVRASASLAGTSTLLTASFVDTFFTSNQFVDASPSHPLAASALPSTPSRSFSSPISRLGAGVGGGSGQGYNVTGAELPQLSVNTTSPSVSSLPAWMAGEGEGGSSGSGTTGASGSGSGAVSSTGTASASGSVSGSASGSGSGSSTGSATASCGGSASGSASMSASGYVSVSDISEDESAGAITFQVQFSGTAPCGFTVDYSTSDGTATSAVVGNDYASDSDSISFAGTSGETVDITINITDDNIYEEDEDFTLTLDAVNDAAGNPVAGVGIGSGAGAGSGTASGSGSGGGGSAVGTIVNDDPCVGSGSLAIADIVVSEGAGSADLVVTFTGTSPCKFTVEYTTADGTASYLPYHEVDPTLTPFSPHNGMDYTRPDPAVVHTIEFGGTTGETQNITIDINDDVYVEADENFTVTLSSLKDLKGNAVTGISLSPAAASVTIDDNDSAVISFAIVTASGGTPPAGSNAEGATGTSRVVYFQPTLSAVVDVPVTFNWHTVDGSAKTSDSDYGGSTSGGGQTFPALLNGPPVIGPTVLGDDKVELNESFTIVIDGINAGGRDVTLAGGGVSQQITVQIDNDDAAKVSFKNPTESKPESNSLTFTLVLDEDVDVPVDVIVLTNGITATPGQDYTAATGAPITFSGTKGEEKTYTVPVNPDAVPEPNETLNAYIDSINASGRDVTPGGQSTSEGTIENDD